MQGSKACKTCELFVTAHGVRMGGDVAGFCGWSTVPSTIFLQAIDRPLGCSLRGHDIKGQHGHSVEQARLWVEAARGQALLEQQQFRGVRLDQVCATCLGEGVDPQKLDRVLKHKEQRWHYACTDCRGRGHQGERAT